MRRILTPGVLAPLLLALAGAALIIAGQLDVAGPPSGDLPDIPDPNGSGAAVVATPAGGGPTSGGDGSPASPGSSAGASETASPSATPEPLDSLATQLQIEAVGINVAVVESTTAENDAYPDTCCAFILTGSSQPGRNTNSYIFAHALNTLFKPLWNVQLGDEVRVAMDDGTVLEYVVTEVRPNVPCPDPNPPNPELNPEAVGVTPPLVLQYAPPTCDDGAAWTAPTDYERLTLQTSQGYNRNWGELVIVAEPVR